MKNEVENYITSGVGVVDSIVAFKPVAVVFVELSGMGVVAGVGVVVVALQ